MVLKHSTSQLQQQPVASEALCMYEDANYSTAVAVTYATEALYSKTTDMVITI